MIGALQHTFRAQPAARARGSGDGHRGGAKDFDAVHCDS
jgi:hypothetical protein